MEELIEFRETLLYYRNPANGKRDTKRKNGSEGPGPLTIDARRELLTQLLELQEQTGLNVISEDELFLIQQHWKTARNPDNGDGVGRILSNLKGIVMKEWKETDLLRDLQEEVAIKHGVRAGTLRRLLAKVEEYSESHRAVGLPDDLLSILKDDIEHEKRTSEDA